MRQSDLLSLWRQARGRVGEELSVSDAPRLDHALLAKGELDELAELCAGQRLVVMVGYCLRFHPAVAALTQAARAGRIGRVLSLRAEVGQYLPDWRPGQDL